MADEARLLAAFALPLLTALLLTPVAISVATRAGFHDHPGGHKAHQKPTPYLGGAAVLGAVLIGSLLAGEDFVRLLPILACAALLWVVGTIDDRMTVRPSVRVAVEAGCGAVLWATDLGWSVTGSEPVDLALTCVWVVALVNAFNLMDNMDGAVGTVTAVTGGVVGILAALEGDIALAALGFGVAGACAGFLRYNLASPARIFLGDGGSMPLGFLVAAMIMALPLAERGWTALVTAILLAGLPLLDTALVVISRRRRGISFLVGGTDHLTHRLRAKLSSTRTVALLLGLSQAFLGAVAIGATEAGHGSVVTAGIIWFITGALAVVLLESRAWGPPLPDAESPVEPDERWGRPPWLRRFSVVELTTVAAIAGICAASPFFFGFYRLSWWGPIALVLLVILLGSVLARPAAPPAGALTTIIGLTAFWALALISTGWAESADQASIEASRWLLYVSVFALLVLLLRNDGLSKLALAATAAAPLVLAGYVLILSLGGTADSLFVSGRLHEPLGYVNGQASYLLLGVWPLIAVAETTRRVWVGASAVGIATLLTSLTLLTQTRAILPVVAITVIAVVAIFPGRIRRVWVLIFITAGTLAASPPLLDLYAGSRAPGSVPPSDDIRRAALWALAVALATGVAWGAAQVARRRLEGGVRFSLAANGPVSLGVLIAVGTATALLALGTIGNPTDYARDQWDAFTQLDGGGENTRFASAGGNRYDYWRIALREFEDEPLRGVGAGNYDRDYFRLRQTAEAIRQPHSLPLQTLAELGVLGLLALLAVLVPIFVGLGQRVRSVRRGETHPALIVAAAGTFLTWFVHSLIDWVHLIPGLTMVALVAAAVLVGPWRKTRAIAGWRWIPIVVGATAVVFGAVTIARLTLADHYRSQGEDLLATEPTRAFEKAQDALSLNDQALPTYYLKAGAYARLNEYEQARATLLHAARLEPHDHVPWVLLGDLAVRRGDFETAGESYGRASKLNPRDTGISALAEDPRSALEPRSGTD